MIEIVDRPERIDAFLPELDRLVTEGLITTEPVHVIAYRRGGGGTRERLTAVHQPANSGVVTESRA